MYIFRLDKILQIEEKLSLGAILQEEQLQTLATRSSVEKSLADIISIKEQIEEIANEVN